MIAYSGPIRLWARDDAGSPVTLRQRMEYGDGGRPDQPVPERAAMRARNLLGQLHRHHDEAGLTDSGGGRFQGQCAGQIPPRHRRCADPRGLRAGTGQCLAGHALPGRLGAPA